MKRTFELGQLRAFVEADEVVRPALPAILGTRPLERAELEHASLVAQHHVVGVVAGAAAHDRDQPLLHGEEVRIGAPEDHRAPVRRDREAEQQVALAAAGRAAIEQDVGRRVVGRDLRRVARLRRPQRTGVAGAQHRVEPGLAVGQHGGDAGVNLLRVHRAAPRQQGQNRAGALRVGERRGGALRRHAPDLPRERREHVGGEPLDGAQGDALAAARLRRPLDRAVQALALEDRLAPQPEQRGPAGRASPVARRIVLLDRLARERDAEFLAHAAHHRPRIVERREPLHHVFLLCGRQLARSAGRPCGSHACSVL